MKSLCVIFIATLTTAFIYEDTDTRPQRLNALGWVGKQADKGVSNIIKKWLARHAPGKAGNEGEYHLPYSRDYQPMIPVSNSGMVNDRRLTGFGQQVFGPGAGGMQYNNQYFGPQQTRELGAYRGPALNRAAGR